MAERVFLLPDLGEGLEEGRDRRWLVAEGDAVELNQTLVEVETAKATVELPSPFAGGRRAARARGEVVPVGAPLVTFEVAPADGGRSSDGVDEPPTRRRRHRRTRRQPLLGAGRRGHARRPNSPKTAGSTCRR